MSPTFDSLTEQALALPPEQRFELAERLWLSVEFQNDEQLMAEIARRDGEMDRKVVQTFSHEDVMRDAKKAIDQ
jgi:hypothetical protein